MNEFILNRKIISDFNRKLRTLTMKEKAFGNLGIRTMDLHIPRLAVYHLNYSGSIEGTSLNFSLEIIAIEGSSICDTICHE